MFKNNKERAYGLSTGAGW